MAGGDAKRKWAARIARLRGSLERARGSRFRTKKNNHFSFLYLSITLEILKKKCPRTRATFRLRRVGKLLERQREGNKSESRIIRRSGCEERGGGRGEKKERCSSLRFETKKKISGWVGFRWPGPDWFQEWGEREWWGGGGLGVERIAVVVVVGVEVVVGCCC